MLENKIAVLWKAVDVAQNRKFIGEDGWSVPERVGSVNIRKGSRIMHEDLEALFLYLKTGDRKDRQWSVVAIECMPDDYEPDQALGPGWYKARHDLVPQNHFMPLSEVEKMYEAQPNDSKPNLDVPISQLPWPKSISRSLAKSVFVAHFGREPTAKEVYNLITSSYGKTFVIDGFGKRIAIATREAYRSIGIHIAPYNYQKKLFLESKI